MQSVQCPGCGAAGFSVALMYVARVTFECKKCGREFYLYGERADEKTVNDLERKTRKSLTLSELFEMKLHGFEIQTGERGEFAASLFEQYTADLFDETIESIDDDILKRLRKKMFDIVKTEGMGEVRPGLEAEIWKQTAGALEKAGYNYVDEDYENAD